VVGEEEEEDWDGSGESDDGEDGYGDYYEFNDDYDDERCSQFNNNDDPEYFAYECLSVESVETIFNESIGEVRARLQLTHSQAKQLLHANKWDIGEILARHPPSSSSSSSSVSHHTPRPPSHPVVSSETASASRLCPVCADLHPGADFVAAQCGHSFCSQCWEMHCSTQIAAGVSTYLACMAARCQELLGEDFVLSQLTNIASRERYKHLCFLDYVRCHPNLRFCPGPNCNIVIKAAESVSKQCVCVSCKTSFCFKCGNSYHAPTSCETIRRWLTKCADDSETANYISANTKDCPRCNICIEKNGGCNHMQCYNCKHDFCWMCLGDWRNHGSEYYECSRYKENPNIVNESVHAQAREALKKYLHYFERWENHSRSMKLEAVTLDNIRNRITERVMSNHGTWIDWQYLFDAAKLLARCRYTLQYTYPYAYYIEASPKKNLFEYQQAKLEVEIENLSWKIEHAETTDRGNLENQMDIAEKRRASLLKDFLVS